MSVNNITYHTVAESISMLYTHPDWGVCRRAGLIHCVVLSQVDWRPDTQVSVPDGDFWVWVFAAFSVSVLCITVCKFQISFEIRQVYNSQ